VVKKTVLRQVKVDGNRTVQWPIDKEGYLFAEYHFSRMRSSIGLTKKSPDVCCSRAIKSQVKLDLTDDFLKCFVVVFPSSVRNFRLLCSVGLSFLLDDHR